MLALAVPVALAPSAGASAAAQGVQTELAFNKLRFAFHAGLAFAAFHHFIYKPLLAGDFKDPGHHKAEIVKAGLAALFIYHEVKLALAAAKGDKLLSKAVAPLTTVGASVLALKDKLKSGHLSSADTSAIAGDNKSVAAVESTSSAAGQAIKEPATVPGLG